MTKNQKGRRVGDSALPPITEAQKARKNERLFVEALRKTLRRVNTFTADGDGIWVLINTPKGQAG